MRRRGRRSSELLDQSTGWTRRDRREAVFLFVLAEDQKMTLADFRYCECRLPVLRTLSLWTCRRQSPVQQPGIIFSYSPSRISLPPTRVGLHIDPFETCSAFTRVAACTLALSPIRTLIEGFSHFVTSMTAPLASGWSGCRVGACTHCKAPPLHGARQKRPFHSRPTGQPLDASVNLT